MKHRDFLFFDSFYFRPSRFCHFTFCLYWLFTLFFTPNWQHTLIQLTKILTLACKFRVDVMIVCCYSTLWECSFDLEIGSKYQQVLFTPLPLNLRLCFWQFILFVIHLIYTNNTLSNYYFLLFVFILYSIFTQISVISLSINPI